MAPAIRKLRDSDSLVDLTNLIHRAYAPLASRGFNYTGVDQPVEETAKRISRGQCAVAEIDGTIVGTITVIRPRFDRATRGYCEPHVASVHQFAVEPKLQGNGIGLALMSWAESWARDQGYRHLAVDTAESAHHLIAYYAKRGYGFVEFAQWPGKQYRSIICSKKLEHAP